MSRLWFVARTEISHQLREKETLVWVFVMPLVFFYFIGTVTGSGTMGGGPARPDTLVLDAPADAGFLADELARRLEAQHFRIVRPDPSADAPAAARRLVIPPPAGGRTFTEAVLAREPMTLRLESRAEGPAANFDRIRIQRAVYALVADLALAGSGGNAPDAAALEAVARTPRTVTLEVTSAGRRVEVPSGFEQTIPGTMVMFTMLVLLTGGAIRLVIEREQGLLRRLASTPLSRTHLVAGKWIGKLLLGLVQIGFALVAGTVLFQMRWGAALPMVLVVLFAWAAFNASLGMLLGNLARSPAQMSGIGVISTLVLAALGGCWWPIEITPDWAQRLALALPTGWAMDAMHRLVSFGETATAAVPHTLAIAAGAAVAGLAAVRTFRYQ